MLKDVLGHLGGPGPQSPAAEAEPAHNRSRWRAPQCWRRVRTGL